jgi:hypothetical protein
MRPNPDSHLETNVEDSDDESITNLTENIEKYRRNSSSLVSNQRVADIEQNDNDEESESEESVNPFLVQKERDESEESIDDESDDESIFDKLRDEVQLELYPGRGPGAVINRFRDSRVEVMSN